MNKKRKKKAFVFSILAAAIMLLPANSSAQGQDWRQGGLFGGPQPTNNNNQSLLNLGNRGGNGMEWQGGGMTAQDPTQEAPLGGGLLVLMAAGAGYAAMKSKPGKEEPK